ncbi:hypothetical protein EC968_003128 [Mortierella alpina]|nr:hypothetical protein EC968_003128 [Mortierella alpina]
MAGFLQAVLPIYFDFRISVAQTKAVDKDDKQSIQDSKNEDDNFYAGGSSHHWVQYYTTEEDQKLPEEHGSVLTMDEFIASSSNPLSMYFLQPEEDQPSLPFSPPRLELGVVKESWIEKEMRAREASFTEHGFMHAFVGTWNVNGKNATEKLDAWLKVEGEQQPEIYVLCFQELDLSAEAYIVLDGSKEEEWTRAIAESLGAGYQKVMSKQLVGLLIVMYAAVDHTKFIREVTAHSAGVGIMGMLGNKGGVSIRIRYKDSYLCFVGSHLAADTSQIDRRNQDYQELCRRITFPSMNSYDITKSPAGNAALAASTRMVSIFDCDHTIWAGDLNYRIGLPEEQVKHHLKTQDYDALLKHDQLSSQRSMLKAFSEFEEHAIAFPPTYKYDVGTNIWDSSEKRRVPSYTDRILWRSKDPEKDSVEPLYYKSHMDLLLSDHKPVSALFKLKVKTLLHDKQLEVHQAIVRELDRYENECLPDATLSTSNIVFDEVRYLEPKKTSLTLTNTGTFPAQYRFKPKLQDERFCRPWIWANPPRGMIMPGESARIQLTAMADNESAPMLNMGKETMEDILILHLEHGKDYFITVSGSYIRTCFGNSLEWLSRLDRPIRLWTPDEDDEDENDEDDSSTLFELQNTLGTKSSTSSMKDSAKSNGNDSLTDSSKHVKNVRSLDSLSEKETLQRRSSIAASINGVQSMQLSDEKRAPPKKQKPMRQQSLPKDLWRIVDFIYKHGFSVDNLFLLSGDQSTMTYIRECLDTGDEFDLTRLLDKPPQSAQSHTESNKPTSTKDNHQNTGKQHKKNKHKNKEMEASKEEDDKKEDKTDESNPRPTSGSSKTLSSRGSSSDLKPQIARPVSIMNGIPPKAATFGLGENRGIHSMAEVLLRFLESLHEPVVPTEMYYRALEIAGHQQAAYGLLDLMPPVHVNVFVYITSFLRELILVGGGQHGAPSSLSTAGATSASTATSSGASASNSGGTGTGEAVAGGPGGSQGSTGTGPSNSGGPARVLQSSSASIYNANDAISISGRGKKEDEDYRIAKLGAERLSEVEALRRKTFLMQFLQEPVEEEGAGGTGTSSGVSAPPSATTVSVGAHEDSDQ